MAFNRMRKYLFITFFFLMIGKTYAQEELCATVLQQAQEEFIAGRFYSIPSLLKVCLDNGFTREQKKDAYLLLTRAYLYIDDPIGAENAFLQLLTIDPEYIASSPRDPIELVFLSQRYTTRPILTLHAKVGVNVSQERMISAVSFSGLSDVIIKNNPGLGFHLSGGVDYNFSDMFSLGTELNIVQRSFKRNTFLVNDPQNVNASQFLFEIPVYLKYQKNLGQLRPFAYAGFAMNMLVADGWTLELEHKLGTGESDPSRSNSSSRINVLPARNIFNRSLVFGGGLLYKAGANFLKAELTYTAGLNNYVDATAQIDYAIKNPSSSYNQLFDYGYIDNYFSVNNLALSVGFVKPLYRPRLKKKTSIKSINRKMISEEEGGDDK
jgi:hypothetical protein